MRSRALRRRAHRLLPVLALCLAALPAAAQADGVVVGAEAFIPESSTQAFARWVRFRPADGATVTLNPPRLSWPYVPAVIDPTWDRRADTLFTLQIGSDAELAAPLVEVRDTPYNFYNFLPVLRGADQWYWRVGYDVGTPEERWSAVRAFRLAPTAVEWDRSRFGDLLDTPLDHPRILLGSDQRDDLLQPGDGDGRRLSPPTPVTRAIFDQILADADAAVAEPWFGELPDEDCPDYDPADPEPRPACRHDYAGAAESLTAVQFAYLLTGDEKYAGYEGELLKIAAYPPGGLSSPEGLNPLTEGAKVPTHVSEYLAYFYDWSHHLLSPGEREVVRSSLEWRIDHVVNDFAWRSRTPEGDHTLEPRHLPLIGWSHEYQAIWPTVIAALAIFDESPVGRQALELGLHYIVGVTNSYGEDEAWNEGPGYGNDKLSYLVDATVALTTALPELHLERNEAYREYVDFFSRVTPVGGARRSSFGNRSGVDADWTGTRMRSFRRLALLLSDGQAMLNWYSTAGDRLDRGRELSFSPSWSNYSFCAYEDEPAALPEADRNRAFAEEGWVTVSSAPPSDAEAQGDAVGMVFQARPRGAYGHSFASDNAFDLHAFGETLAVGGGSTGNGLGFPRSSLSHNTVLVDGVGQRFSSFTDYAEGRPAGPASDLEAPVRARLIAYQEGSAGETPYVYWAGSAAPAYDPAAGLDRFVRHVVFVDEAWFVIFDELQMAPGRSARFQWLWHTPPAPGMEVDFDPEAFSFSYTLGEAQVLVRHLAGTDELDYTHTVGADGQLNVFLCGADPEPGSCPEDFRDETAVQAHHLWVESRVDAPARTFLAAVVPSRTGDAPAMVRPVAGTEAAVEVEHGGRTVVVSFDPTVPGDILIDVASITGRQGESGAGGAAPPPRDPAARDAGAPGSVPAEATPAPQTAADTPAPQEDPSAAHSEASPAPPEPTSHSAVAGTVAAGTAAAAAGGPVTWPTASAALPAALRPLLIDGRGPADVGRCDEGGERRSRRRCVPFRLRPEDRSARTGAG